MFTFIRQGVRESPGKQRRNSGFTIPEILVSLLICGLLLQSVGQWSVLTANSGMRIQQNEQAILLAQTVLTDGTPDVPDGWQISVEETQQAALRERLVTVSHENQSWSFYYAGV